jgi:hypothetical protein
MDHGLNHHTTEDIGQVVQPIWQSGVTDNNGGWYETLDARRNAPVRVEDVYAGGMLTAVGEQLVHRLIIEWETVANHQPHVQSGQSNCRLVPDGT